MRQASRQGTANPDPARIATAPGCKRTRMVPHPPSARHGKFQSCIPIRDPFPAVTRQGVCRHHSGPVQCQTSSLVFFCFCLIRVGPSAVKDQLFPDSYPQPVATARSGKAGRSNTYRVPAPHSPVRTGGAPHAQRFINKIRQRNQQGRGHQNQRRINHSKPRRQHPRTKTHQNRHDDSPDNDPGMKNHTRLLIEP